MRLHARSTAPAAADARVDSQIVWFVVLAFGSSWAWLVPVALTAAPVSAGVGWPTHVPALFGPMLAAFVVTATREGRVAVVDLLGRMGRFRVPMRWWLFALSPLLVLLFVLVVDLVAGRPLPDSRDFATFSGLPASWGPWGVGTVLLLLALGEETGWRGYLLPRLQQQVSPLMATVVVAAVWALWHAPMFVVVDTYRSFDVAITMGWAMSLFCGAVVLSWLYNRSGGSILLVAIWHAGYNVVAGTSASTGLLAATSTTLVIALAVTLVVLEIRAGRHATRSVLAPLVPLRLRSSQPPARLIPPAPGSRPTTGRRAAPG